MTERSGVEVRLEKLVRRYGTVTALDGLSLTIAPGELVALLGPSGCGKTTALRLLAGLEEADDGRVVIAGKDVTGLPTSRRNVGMVFQAYSLFPHMVAWENVAFGLQMRGGAQCTGAPRAPPPTPPPPLRSWPSSLASPTASPARSRAARSRFAGCGCRSSSPTSRTVRPPRSSGLKQ